MPTRSVWHFAKSARVSAVVYRGNVGREEATAADAPLTVSDTATGAAVWGLYVIVTCQTCVTRVRVCGCVAALQQALSGSHYCKYDADDALMSLQGQPSSHGATAPSSSLLPRISAASEGSRRTSANGTGRVSSGGGVAGDDMAPHKRTFTKSSMQVRICRQPGEHRSCMTHALDTRCLMLCASKQGCCWSVHNAQFQVTEELTPSICD